MNSTCVKLCVTPHIFTNKLLFYLWYCFGCIEQREYEICFWKIDPQSIQCKQRKNNSKQCNYLNPLFQTNLVLLYFLILWTLTLMIIEILHFWHTFTGTAYLTQPNTISQSYPIQDRTKKIWFTLYQDGEWRSENWIRHCSYITMSQSPR